MKKPCINDEDRSGYTKKQIQTLGWLGLAVSILFCWVLFNLIDAK